MKNTVIAARQVILAGLIPGGASRRPMWGVSPATDGCGLRSVASGGVTG